MAKQLRVEVAYCQFDNTALVPLSDAGVSAWQKDARS